MQKQIVKYVSIGFLIIFVIVLLFNSCYTLKETETAVVTTFGKAELKDGRGLQFKIPFIQKVKKVDSTIQGFSLGYKTDEDGNMIDVDDESMMITSDYNFIMADFYISYQIVDPIAYLYNSEQPKLILKNIVQNCVRSTMSAYTVDAALTTGKTEIQANIKTMTIENLEKVNIGIKLTDISMQDVEPPTEEVKNAFKAVETAKQNKESAINEANKYRNEQLPSAEAQVNKVIQDSEATKTSRINEANGQVSRFNDVYEEYSKYPLITKQRMFYETMEELLPKLKVIIDSGDGTIEKIYPVQSFLSSASQTTETSN